jgi:segregation and condensation protein B
MSLKAKLEAVIYAAEEPVTLAQLAALFADEALEWKAEQAAAAAEAEAATESEQAAEAAPLLHGEFAQSEAAPSGEESAPESAEPPPAEMAEAPTEPQPLVAEEAPAEAEAAPEEVAGEASDETSAEAAAAAEPAEPEESEEARTRRLARQRDREVKTILRQLLDELVAESTSDNRGVEIREIAGGYRMATKPECHDAVRGFVKSLKPALKLSLPALETLAVIAYKQPVTAPEVNEIRGVDASGVFGSLLARKLIATAGRKQVIGRPILYKTTKEFLLRFGLKDVNELPSMEEFEKMAASELEEPEVSAQNDSAPAAPTDPALELDENASEEENGSQPAVSAAGPAEESETPTPEDAPAEPPPTA